MSTLIRSFMTYMIVIAVTLIEEHYLKSQEMTQEPEIVYKILYDIYDCYFSDPD